MDSTAITYFVVALAVLGLSIWNRKRNPMGVPASSLLIVLGMLTSLMVSVWNAFIVTLPYPQSTHLYPYYAAPFPVFDAVGLVVCAWMLERQRSWWCAILFLSFSTAEAVHYGFWSSNPDKLSYSETIASVAKYSDKLNWLAYAQLAIVAVPGGLFLGSLVGRAISNLLGRAGAFADKASIVRKVAKEP